MTCTQFHEWLDEGGFTFSTAPEAEPFLAHSRECPTCAASLKKYETILATFQGIGPSPAALKRIHEGITARVSPKTTVPASPTLHDSPWAGFFRSPVFAAGLTLIFMIGLLALNTLSHPKAPVETAKPVMEIASVSGPVTILRQKDQSEVRVGNTPVGLFAGDRLSFKSGPHIVLQYPDSRTISISGNGECVVTNLLKFERGQGSFIFAKGRQYQVQMPEVNLTILGTTLHLQTGKGVDEVWVQEGSIEWQTTRGSPKSGALQGGKGLKFSGGGTTTLAASPLQETRVGPQPKPASGSATVDPTIPGEQNPSE